MLFNSLSFAVFLPLVFGLYWLIASPKGDGFVSPTRLNLQNLFVVAASYVFYGWWDWKFLLLITFTSLWAWASGLALARFQYTPNRYAGGGQILSLSPSCPYSSSLTSLSSSRISAA